MLWCKELPAKQFCGKIKIKEDMARLSWWNLMRKQDSIKISTKIYLQKMC